jgi:beta-phosphoglucomutase
MNYPEIRGVVFDLDGVICSTDEYHYEAWKAIADREGIPFDRTINNQLRGISRRDSFEIILKKASRSYSEEEKEKLCTLKNEIYRKLLAKMSPSDVSEDVLRTLKELRKRGIRTAIGSSSKNTSLILIKTGLTHAFDAVADGNEIKHSKPDPEVFLLAAKKIALAPQQCFVIEDGVSGIIAANKGGFVSVGISDAAKSGLAKETITEISDILALLG